MMVPGFSAGNGLSGGKKMIRALPNVAAALLMMIPGAAEAAPGTVSLPVALISGAAAPVPDLSAAQSVPPDKRPIPKTIVGFSLAPVPPADPIAGSPIGNGKPDPASLPKPTGDQ
jgi:hypothetical protein